MNPKRHLGRFRPRDPLALSDLLLERGVQRPRPRPNEWKAKKWRARSGFWLNLIKAELARLDRNMIHPLRRYITERVRSITAAKWSRFIRRARLGHPPRIRMRRARRRPLTWRMIDQSLRSHRLFLNHSSTRSSS